MHKTPNRIAGFSLIELIVALAIIGIAVAAAAPAFNGLMRRTRSQTVLTEMSNALINARHEAVRRNTQVIAQPLPNTQELFIFANMDGDDALLFQPDATAVPFTADFEVARIRIPAISKVYFSPPPGNGNGNNRAPGNGNGNGNGNSGIVDGLTVLDAGENGVVFEGSGAVRDVGSIRLGDAFGNYFEVRVGPAATGKVKTLKHRIDPPWGDPTGYYPRGTDPNGLGPMWKWYSGSAQ